MTHPILPLSWRPLLDDASFCVGDTNEEAFQWIQAQTWPVHHLNIYGPKGSGKTHLGSLWARKEQAVWLPCSHESFVSPQGKYILDLTDQTLDPQELFFFLEKAHHHSAQCLWLSHAPLHFNETNPALKSRLTTFLCVQIQEPNDGLLLEVMKKAFKDVGLIACPNVLEFLMKRMERSFLEIGNVTEKIHHYITRHQVNLTIPTVKSALDWKNASVFCEAESKKRQP